MPTNLGTDDQIVHHITLEVLTRIGKQSLIDLDCFLEVSQEHVAQGLVVFQEVIWLLEVVHLLLDYCQRMSEAAHLHLSIDTPNYRFKSRYIIHK